MKQFKSILSPVVALLLACLGGACRPSEPERESAPSTPEPAPPATAPAPVPPPAEPPTSDLGTDLAPPAEPAPSGVPGAGPTTELPRDRPLRAGFLVVDGVYNTELAAPYEKPDEAAQFYRSDRGMMAQVEASVLEDQVVDFLLERARCTTTNVSFKDFMGA